MGGGASVFKRPIERKEIYIDNGYNKIQKIIVNQGMRSTQLEEILITITGCDRSLPIVLMSSEGLFFALSPVSAIPANDANTPYKVQMVYDNAAYVQLTQNVTKMQQEIGEIKEILQIHRSVSNKLTQPKTTMGFCEFPINGDLEKSLKSPQFNVWSFKYSELLCFLEFMFKDIDIIDELNIHPLTLRKWLMCVKDNYRDVPFHNFRHCFSVVQMMYSLIYMCNFKKIFSRFELSILLIACACHDVDHPGLSNNYQVNARTELALRYNDISPLENHHCTTTFRILSQPELNLFFNASMDEFRKARKLIIKLILATDMIYHKDIMGRFQSKMKQLDFEKDEDKYLLMEVMIKLCDLSNEVRSLESSQLWIESLLQEYFAQGDLEKREGLTVDPLMDRNHTSKAKAQIGFIRLILLPMYENVAGIFPAVGEQLVPKLHAALSLYEEMRQKEEQFPTKSRLKPATRLSSPKGDN